ncbi:Glycoside hydrolase superfamily [Penicillium robsamsonii]|uniref:Glycoside hydrolase superfamily n=1 Tax=Penicillium robsamsonii TaxID=1792511 RepID=UPI002548BD19|nr:Glycoside hydrolase superfamily [Penicillium robsamsonii]KAJ5822619.1 Glycoside hydrolase superfamily [Penicillium robsamsonii]
MASPRAKAGASRSAKSSNPPTRRGYTSLQNPPVEHSTSESSWGQNDGLDTPSSGDESSEQGYIKLRPLKHGRARDARPSSSKTNGPNPTPIDIPDDERDVSKRIKDLLEADRTALSHSFATDLEEGHSDRDSLLLSDRYSDDYGIPPDKGLLLKDKKGENGEKGSDWRSLFRLQSWWNVAGMFTIAILVVWFSIRGLPWSPATAGNDGFQTVPWYPTPLGGTSAQWKESYAKAQEMVREMTLTEKVNVTTGTGWQMGLCVGNTGPAELVKFPSLCLQDGPLGLRFAQNITAFPAGITTGATWNRELMKMRGLALGNEARLKGVNIILGPSMGPLGMMPVGGRNWEAFGSDPVLQGVAAAETIRGIQQNGVMATAKHFVGNEQEHFRQAIEWGTPTALSSNIDDRALHEVFAWPFAESVRADVASIMCSYQMVNNSYACENSKLINGILKDELGFQGFVQSDWLAQRSGVHSAIAGLDMSMPGDGLSWANGIPVWGSELTRAALNTSVPMERLNDMVTRIVAAWYHFGQDLWELPAPEGDGGPNFSSWTKERVGNLHEGSPDNHTTGVVNKFVDAQGTGDHAHSIVARQIAAEGTVLLKNINNTLPLSRENSTRNGKHRVGVYGEDAGSGKGPNSCADRGCNQGTLASGWGSGAVDFPYLVSPWEALQHAWSKDSVDVKAYLTNDVAPQDLAEQDLCLVFVNADGGEGFIRSDGIDADRNDLFLQKNGTQLVEGVAKHCGGGQGKTIVIVHSIGPVVMESWIDLPGVHGVLYANLPGQESGNALVDVLFGDVDASGRLPYTIGRRLEDYGPGAQVLYENPDSSVPQVNFDEGLYIDYRYFDKFNITPRFEFGFGLSYTTFDYTALSIQKLQKKSQWPSKRPANEVEPPAYDKKQDNPTSNLFPPGFRALRKYIYPYLTTLEGTEPGPYPYPEGYNKSQNPSAAGGGPGGNPSLYEPMLEVTIEVTNTGTRTGQDVIQVYVSFPDDVAEHRGLGWSRESIEFPKRVLRNFSKVLLQPGETRNVKMTLTRKDLSYWSVRAQNWVLPIEGKFRIWAGRSSRNLPLVVEF